VEQQFQFFIFLSSLFFVLIDANIPAGPQAVNKTANRMINFTERT
jgi:hypothetical protein